ncbi:hypothetical protein PP940_gp102 [Rhizobium phage RL2RES]|uniref:Uncharacterized protein n=1 Tax=Rhizobium phage RL2RES TaxID=103371 RepID=A0A6B9J1X0_9CAUD|nr:hypothetical protein PP940_gp102 [Rhizobium phage RL2RES]QGZ14237.1 hypothetical protein RL2RES_102 [Rhizobium phage RL2RES]
MIYGHKKIVSGFELFAQLEAEKNARVGMRHGDYNGDQLSKLQQEHARRGILGAEIVITNYGFSVRYDSGLQNWGLLASCKAKQIDGTLEAAVKFAEEWVAKDPTRRYAWIRNLEV